MNRIATVPLQTTMSSSIGKTQVRLSELQQQLASGKKATDLASLGSETGRNLSARSLVSRQEAQLAVSKRVETSLQLYESHITQMDDVTSQLRTDILRAVGTEQGAGLQDAAEAAFDQIRAALNATEAGIPMFGGAQDGAHPFVPKSLAETAGMDAQDAFTNDDVRRQARVAEGLDLEYGVLADEVGSKLFEAFKTIAEAGPIGSELTAAQKTALTDALDQMDGAIGDIRDANSANGRRQAQAEQVTRRAEDRMLVLKQVISNNEDADLGDVAMELSQVQTRLEASYSVFARLANLNLGDYLR